MNWGRLAAGAAILALVVFLLVASGDAENRPGRMRKQAATPDVESVLTRQAVNAAIAAERRQLLHPKPTKPTPQPRKAP